MHFNFDVINPYIFYIPIFFRYEDLVENTETNLEQIYKFLELPYSDQAFFMIIL